MSRFEMTPALADDIAAIADPLVRLMYATNRHGMQAQQERTFGAIAEALIMSVATALVEHAGMTPATARRWGRAVYSLACDNGEDATFNLGLLVRGAAQVSHWA